MPFKMLMSLYFYLKILIFSLIQSDVKDISTPQKMSLVTTAFINRVNSPRIEVQEVLETLELVFKIQVLTPQLRYQYNHENSIYFWDTVRGSDASGWRQETGSLYLKVGAIHSLDTNCVPAYGVLVRSTRRSVGLEEVPSSELCTKSF